MEIVYLPQAVSDLKYWKKSGNLPIQKKIKTLIEAIKYEPFEGIGKPEELKHQLSGSWSRRINKEHRIVYEVKDQIIEIQSIKGHY